MICIKYLKRGFYNERRISGKLFRIMDVTRKNVYESQINEVVAADFGIRFLVCACFNAGSDLLSSKDDVRYRLIQS